MWDAGLALFLQGLSSAFSLQRSKLQRLRGLCCLWAGSWGQTLRLGIRPWLGASFSALDVPGTCGLWAAPWTAVGAACLPGSTFWWRFLLRPTAGRALCAGALEAGTSLLIPWGSRL